MTKFQTLNLVHDNESDVKYNITTFPDGEPTIELLNFNNKYPVRVICRVCNPNDLYLLMCVCNILERYENAYSIHISYLMSCRMDRVMSPNRPFSLKFVVKILLEFKTRYIEVIDAHTSLDIFAFRHGFKPHFINKSITACIPEDVFRSKRLHCYPDEGALARYQRIMPKQCEAVYYEKHRNEAGLVTVQLNEHFTGMVKDTKSILLIDDILDGGSTMRTVIDNLRSINKDIDITVCITHCVNRNGLESLLSKHVQVITTNSYKDWDSEFSTEIRNKQLIVYKVI